MKAPFPFFGGKSRIVNMVWERFGRVENYVESFFGSGAMLLGCPHPGHTETVNDADGLLANFYRALQHDPDAVALHADWPVNEADLHARHRWLVDRRSMVEELMADPDWYDAKTAGWWVWGISQWIGTGWCPPDKEPSLQAPYLQAQMSPGSPSGQGINAPRLTRGQTKDGGLWQQRPMLGGDRHDGMGVHKTSLSRQMPEIGAAGGGAFDGRGVHRKALGKKMPFIASPSPDRKQYGLGIHGKRLSQQTPNLQGDSGATGQGVHRETLAEEPSALYDYFRALAARLRRTRVVCGDFARILGPSVTWRHGLTAVFLDPPYADAEHAVTYAGGGDVWKRVTDWCEENGDNKLLRIALCGYESTWTPPAGWQAIKWRTPGGYGSQGNGRGRENAAREVVWFSPHCLDLNALPLFAGLEDL